MPELPEVETTLRGIAPYVTGKTLTRLQVRNPALRWQVPVTALSALNGKIVSRVERRAKYLLLHTEQGAILLHLGMSGSLRVLPAGTLAQKHDHIDFEFDGKHIVRFNDPRRFGCCLLLTPPIAEHKLLAHLGPEPLSDDFDGEVLFAQSRTRKLAVKNMIMDAKVVVGVGNIYASESLYQAGIRPTMAAKRISRARYQRLADNIKAVLAKAIKAGGTTLNDFTQSDGKPGYFSHELQVYGRAGQACYQCDTPIKSQIIGQRNTFYCPQCQRF